jgi:hypothetical protein
MQDDFEIDLKGLGFVVDWFRIRQVACSCEHSIEAV